MANQKKKTSKRGPRGTKAQIEAVTKSGRKAGRDLRKEHDEAETHLAEALGEITEGETLAHLEMRLSFIERQVERLMARRDETDRGLQGEIEVMRARIEDALEAVSATAGEQEKAGVGLEKRLSQMMSRVEERSSDAIANLREELASQLAEVLDRVEKAEARLRGQARALEDAVEERLRIFSASLTEESERRETIQENLDEALESLRRLLSSEAELREELEKRVGDSIQQMESRTAEAADESQRQTREAVAHIDETAGEVRERLQEASEQWDRQLEKASGRLDEHLVEVSERLDELTSRVDSRLEEFDRETSGRLSEVRAESRLEAQRLGESLDEKLQAVSEAMGELRRDLTTRVQAAVQEAGASSSRLESLLAQQRRELVSEEAEFSETFKEIVEEISALKIRSEELVGRVASAEARRASERGASQVAIEGVSGRLETLENRVREAVEDISAKQATRLEMLSSKVSKLSATNSEAEESSGAMEYLSRRVGELAEQLGEAMTKVNAIGRFVTKPDRAPVPEGLVAVPREVQERLDRIEETLASLIERPPVVEQVEPSEDPELPRRIAGLERAVRSLAERPAGNEDLAGRLEALERQLSSFSTTIASRQAQIAEKVEVLEGSKSPAENILPSKRRRW